jgi:transposase
MQDNDPKHKSKRTQEWFRINKVNVLDWPPRSPDLNPIEHLWNHVDQKIRKRKEKPKNVNELWEIVKEEWHNIDCEIIRNLYLSMTKRIDALRKNNGSYTKW